MSGAFGSSQWMYSSGAAEFYSYELSQSLRFNDNDSAYLSRTPASAGNRKTFTFSVWIKLNPTATNYPPIFSAGTSAPDTVIRLDNTGKLTVVLENGGGGNSSLATSAQLRDPSSWYHIVCTVDTTNATADDRIKIYINGTEQTSYSGRTNPSLNLDTNVNNTVLHRLGLQRYGSYWDGYMAEVNFIDGTALDPTSFGETINGIWVPKAYDTADGAYGTNGFYLSFADSSAIGDDLSGNTNDWTANNLAASDVVPDSPTNNFATLNVLDSHAASTYSEGNLKFADGGGDGANAHSTMVIPEISNSDTYYAEVRVNAAGYAWGISPVTLSGAAGSTTRTGMLTVYHNGRRYNGATAVDGSNNDYVTVAVGDIFGIKAGNGKLEFFQNGTSLGDAFTSLSGTYKFGCWAIGAAGTGITWNFGQDSTFHGQETAGTTTDQNGYGLFNDAEAANNISLCAANIAEPTISPNSEKQADDYFNTVLYTGDGSASNAITGTGHQPDFLWIKQRDAIRGHQLMDSVRGASVRLQSHVGVAEAASALVSFDSDGFTVDGTTLNGTNITGGAFVAWNWKAGGAAVSNTDGSITSSVSANQDAGFSIVTWVGNNTDGATVGHGLTDPEFSIVKNRDSGTNWDVCWSGFTSGTSLNLDTTAAEFSPTTGYQQLGTSTITLKNGGTGIGRVNGTPDDYVAYVFKSVPGYSAVGKYVGNGNADGTFVFTGFRPAWVLWKRTDSTAGWFLMDTVRDTENVTNTFLRPNASDAEATAANSTADFLSNGFKLRGTGGDVNTNGGTYIYLAFAEAPFKYANAR